MEPVAATYREVCLRCRRPLSVCWCRHVHTVESATKVVFIQHPREAKVAVSTCRMAHLSLPNSELYVAMTAAGEPRLEAICNDPGTALLFPSTSATDVSELEAPPKTLVVVDGTWSNAKKIVEHCPMLSRLPRIRFNPDKPGNYRIRKEPADHCLATIEATAYVLEALEAAPGRFTPILKAFDAMVDRQIEFIDGGTGQSRHKKKTRLHPRRDPVDRIREAADHLVTVFGESNAWPPDHPERPPGEHHELIQLVAERLSTGERFNVLLQPIVTLSPSASMHLALPDALLAQGLPRTVALEQWRAYLRPDDQLVGWGGFCADLLRAEGFEGNWLDARGLLAQSLKRRTGAVETCAQALKVPLPVNEGRAIARLSAVNAVVRAIVENSTDTLRSIL